MSPSTYAPRGRHRSAQNIKLTIEKYSYPADDDFGQADLTDDGQWNAYTTWYAEEIVRGGTEQAKALRQEGAVDYVFHGSYGSEIAAVTPGGYRVKWGSRILQIVSSTTPGGQRVKHELACAELVEGPTS